MSGSIEILFSEVLKQTEVQRHRNQNSNFNPGSANPALNNQPLVNLSTSNLTLLILLKRLQEYKYRYRLSSSSEFDFLFSSMSYSLNSQGPVVRKPNNALHLVVVFSSVNKLVTVRRASYDASYHFSSIFTTVEKITIKTIRWIPLSVLRLRTTGPGQKKKIESAGLPETKNSKRLVHLTQ